MVSDAAVLVETAFQAAPPPAIHDRERVVIVVTFSPPASSFAAARGVARANTGCRTRIRRPTQRGCRRANAGVVSIGLIYTPRSGCPSVAGHFFVQARSVMRMRRPVPWKSAIPSRTNWAATRNAPYRKRARRARQTIVAARLRSAPRRGGP